MWFLTLTLLILSLLTISPAIVVASVPVDMKDFSSDIVEVEHQNNSLVVRWPDESSKMWQIIFSLDPNQPLINKVSFEQIVVMRQGRPYYRVETGKRRKGWNAFFDYPPSHEEGTRSFQGKFQLSSAKVSTTGDRLELFFSGLSMGIFDGGIAYTIFPGSRLIQQEAVMMTDIANTAYFYDAGIDFAMPDVEYYSGADSFTDDPKDGQWGSLPWHRAETSYYDTEGEFQTVRSGIETPERVSFAVRYRTLATRTAKGSIAVFPAPHQYFFPRDHTSNLGNLWQRSWRRRLAIGIRQIGDTNWKFYPWVNAPPGRTQRMSVFFILSEGPPKQVLDDVLAYTNRDRFVELKGYKTLSQHWHLAYTMQAIKEGFDWVPPFKPVLEDMGVDVAIIMDFHGDGHPHDLTELRLEELDSFFKACKAQSNEQFLLIPSEEANVHLGGHWAVIFPKPVYWWMDRPEDGKFEIDHPKYDTVYSTKNTKEMLELVRREGGYMYQTHARTKGSTGYPDGIRKTEYFLDPRYLGAGWKAMPADYSLPRLGERVFTLLDDMNNWGLKKRVFGEVDVFQFDHTHELWGHMNVNYVKLEQLPDFGNYGDVLVPLARGDFFTTTGEVLLPNVVVKSGVGDRIEVEADIRWTFPLRFAEIVWGDGRKTQRKIIPLLRTRQYGEAKFSWSAEAPGWKWARVAVWDVATNGAFVNPVWRQ